MNGPSITDSRELSVRVSLTPLGTSVRLRVFRGGHEREVDLKRGEAPSKPEPAFSGTGQSNL
jgi:S1-C subfamily serine protease